MRHIFLLFVTALLLGHVLPAHAAVGKIFPPDGQSSGSCSNDKVLTWTGKDVKCADPSDGFTPPACPTGQAYYQLRNGTKKCRDLAIPTISCANGSAVQKIQGSAAVCVDVVTGDTTTVSCAAGMVWGKIARARCRYKNPVTNGCSCPTGYVPRISWKFWNPAGTGGFYCSTSYTNCYVTQFTCHLERERVWER